MLGLRIPHGTASEEAWRKFNGTRALVWVAITIIAILAGWIYSVAFVAACSLYANVASDTAAWRSDVNPQLDVIERKLDTVLERLDALEAA